MKKIGKKYSITAIEPLFPDQGMCPQLTDLATELIAKSSGLANRLHPIVVTSLSNLVRSMNCYYSNLIEGHNTHPRDIEKALAENLSPNPKKRALQLEAKAHIEVQRLIDSHQIDFSLSSAFICWIHQAFYERLPEQLLWVNNPDSGKRTKVVAGQFRQEWVQVGYHIPPGPEDIKSFLERFEQGYQLNPLNKIQRVIAVAASHHRLLWIHPFLDGNGRVARLFSHAFLQHIKIGSSLWSIARGLARHSNEYKNKLMEADIERQGDFDGRGALSAKGLEHFCIFFLETCLDQIHYMDNLIEPNKLIQRIELYVEEEQKLGNLPKGSLALLREAFFTGEIARGKASSITGYKERQARTILNTLIKAGLLISDTPKSSVKLHFPLDIVERWFPKLYPISDIT